MFALVMVGVMLVGMRVPVRVAMGVDVAPGVSQGVHPERGDGSPE